MDRFFIFIFLISFHVKAKQVETVHLTQKDIHQVYLKLHETTVLKFDSKPKPAIIGKQDAYLVETFKNVVAIKPIRKVSTNFFVFTKEGHFNFKLIPSPTKYKTLIHVKRKLSFFVEKVSIGTPFKLSMRDGFLFSSKNKIAILFSLSLLGKNSKKYKFKNFKIKAYQKGKKVSLDSKFTDRRELDSKTRKLSGVFIFNKDNLRLKELLTFKIFHKELNKPLKIEINYP